jgi:hypothetical protein
MIRLTLFLKEKQEKQPLEKGEQHENIDIT